MGIQSARISPFGFSNEVAVKLEDFEPTGGNEHFLRSFAAFLGETLADWYQGYEEGGGHFTYRGQRLFVYWSAFPLQLSFDCPNEATAKLVKQDVEAFFMTGDNS